MKYIVAKIITGEILVALAGDLTGEFIQLIQPFEVIKEMIQDEDGIKYRTSIRPYCLFTDDDTVSFRQDHFVFMSNLKADLTENYKELVESYAVPVPPIGNTDTFDVPGNSIAH